MPRFRAEWILPVAGDPIRGGFVTVERGRIREVAGHARGDAVDLGRVAVLPALVNAHTHLELSYLHRRVDPSQHFVEWIRTLMAARRAHPDPADPEILDAAKAAIAQARASGTGLIGDISNTLVTVPLLRDAGVAAHVFYELLGFHVPDARARVAAAREQADAAAAGLSDIRVSLAPHAPYSVGPDLFRAIREDLDTVERHPVTSVHLGESEAEIELLRKGTGPFRDLLMDLGVWTDEWTPPSESPVQYLSDLAFLDSGVLAVHGVQFDGEDLTKIATFGMTVVSCPRSNIHVGVGPPPLEAFYAMDVNVAFGTDSLASVDDLNVFAELAAARRLAPRVPAHRLIESATLAGARALGFDRELGSIEPGKRAALVAVRVPEHVTDVEEYLVSGIDPASITWVASNGDEGHPLAFSTHA